MVVPLVEYAAVPMSGSGGGGGSGSGSRTFVFKNKTQKKKSHSDNLELELCLFDKKTSEGALRTSSIVLMDTYMYRYPYPRPGCSTTPSGPGSPPATSSRTRSPGGLSYFVKFLSGGSVHGFGDSAAFFWFLFCFV